MADAGLPELCISGYSEIWHTMALLRALASLHARTPFRPGQEIAERLKPEKTFTNGAVTEASRLVKLQARAVDDMQMFNQQAHGYFERPHGPPGPVLGIQVMWPDAAGRFPDRPDYDHGRCPQELF
ncbi:hypothetical protein AFR_24610 [Actinoplanes friuliensis DSM 7358]|uniref:Uncharacterized protein n=2 Tax=Actinoplanes friuliensis TaxID=196914 RepID=U5W1U0_9ACTN|nr:hypothetical protein AFR_24610 [Actinoplanes friuliensis DSM 7358]